jgi:hypothetical protein
MTGEVAEPWAWDWAVTSVDSAGAGVEEFPRKKPNGVTIVVDFSAVCDLDLRHQNIRTDGGASAMGSWGSWLRGFCCDSYTVPTFINGRLDLSGAECLASKIGQVRSWVAGSWEAEWRG